MSNNNDNGASGAPTPALTRAVKQLLRPLVGLLLDNGLTFNWLTRILKIIYVDVAVAEFGLKDKPPTDSRVSLLSGVHRKDVRRLRSEDNEAFEPPPSIFIGAKLVSIWTTEPKFLDSSGRPAPLARLANATLSPSDASFEELVTLVSKDIRPRAVLDEWLRLGAVTIDDKDRVFLEVGAFIPTKGFEEKAYFLGKNVHDHMAAARANVQSDHPPFLERSVYYDLLSADSVRILDKLSEEKAMELLMLLNRKARDLQKKDALTGEQDQRINFGIYFYREDD